MRTLRAQPAAPTNPASSPELGEFDPGLRGRDREGHLADVAADLVQQRGAGVDHAAAEEDEVRVDRVHQRDRADGEVAGGIAASAARPARRPRRRPRR